MVTSVIVYELFNLCIFSDKPFLSLKGGDKEVKKILVVKVISIKEGMLGVVN